MGDLSKKLQEMGAGKDFADAVGYAEKAYSMVSGAYAAFAVGEQVLTYLGVLGKPEDPLAKVKEQLNIIQQKLDKILKALEEQKKITVDASKLITRTQIANEVGNASVAAYNAKSFLEFPKNDQIIKDFDEARTDSQIAAEHLRSNEYYWMRIFLPESLHEDFWNGILYPDGVTAQGTDDGYIWDYRMAMSACLAIFATRSIVLLAASPEEKLSHKQEMLNCAQSLCDRYLKILNNFRTTRAPTQQELSTVIPAMNDVNFFVLDIRDNSTHLPLSAEECNDLLLNYIRGGRWRMANYPVGLVEAWTGYTCAVIYPHSELQEGTAYIRLEKSSSFWIAVGPTAGAAITVTDPVAFQAFYDRFVFRHLLRTLVQRARLYNELGMGNVLSCIHYLYATLGAWPSQYLPDYSVRSMREVYDCSPATLQPKIIEGNAISLRKMAEVAGSSGALSARSIFLMDEVLTPI